MNILLKIMKNNKIIGHTYGMFFMSNPAETKGIAWKTMFCLLINNYNILCGITDNK